ncbi:hypothetical protein ACJMK2_034130 [Sinanodonta woodiana]|uniref:Peptidase M3A/M3B catalytic domain-containing protein n=1 Tax=Sinanodonta woodiana TaxID=1069815 RepID=A0ABD3WU33_SINWO
MAASISRIGHVLAKSPWRTNIRHASATGFPYYVLIPEVPRDTPKDNPLLRTKELPKFSEITLKKIITGCAKQALEYETNVFKHIGESSDPKKVHTFESLFHPIEEYYVPMNFALSTASCRCLVSRDEAHMKALIRVSNQIHKAKNERWLNEQLHSAVKEVQADRAKLTEFQKRLVDLYALEGRLNGVELKFKEHAKFMKLLNALMKERKEFSQKVDICKGFFLQSIEDFSVIQDMPKAYLMEMATDKSKPYRGPWNLTFRDKGLYKSFLQTCSNRHMRWNAWQAFNNISSHLYATQYLNNQKSLDDIRSFRSQIARMLGYEHFAQMSMETKMAGSVDNVVNMLESLRLSLYPIAQEELASLNDFARDAGLYEHIQMWDVAYYSMIQNEQLYRIDHSDVAAYFPMNKVFDGLFKLCNKLFGISFTKHSPTPDVWAEGVEVFDVRDSDGSYCGTIYMDLLRRPAGKQNECWVESGRDRSDIVGTTPISYIFASFEPSMIPSRPALMNYQEVTILFQLMGYALQQVLTKVPYSEIAGQRNIEWDALHVCSQFMKHWLSYPKFVQQISAHHETGKQLSDLMVEKLIKSCKPLPAFNKMHDLYLSAYDMAAHSNKEHWNELMMQVWEKYMPIELHKEDNHPCSFTEIISDNLSAAYYSFTWSEMLAADIFEAFQDVGLENDEMISHLGKSFKDTFLSLGGGVPAGEVFRRFRGRDPSVDALKKLYGAK